MKILSNKLVNASEDYSSQNAEKHVAQISIDIEHTGNYDTQAIMDAVSNLGYEVLGIDSTDVTHEYQ